MKILCLNGWGGKLYSQLLAYLASEEPDVLCLQEVVHSPVSDQATLTYRDGAHVLPQRANFFSEVRAVLPHHVATFCPAAQGVLWSGDTAFPSQWGLATFVRDTYPVIGQAQGFVHKGYEPEGYGDHPRSRSAHAVRLYDHAAVRVVSVTHMHGLRDLKGKMDTPERAAQVRKLLALSQQVTDEQDISVICGDFNVEPDSETLGILKAEGMTELVTGNGYKSTRTSHYQKSGKFADYMLINSVEAVKEFRVISTPEVSDHCPLVLEI